MFYRFTGPGGNVTLATCGATTNYDSKLFVFTGTCGNYTCVTGNDDACANNASTVTFASVSGTAYLVYVAGYGSNQGNFSLSATCTAASALAITSFTPSSGPVGTAVTLTGNGFTGATGVTFNGTAAVFNVVSATSATTTVPAGASTGLIRLTTPLGTASSATVFTVTVPAPALTVTPASLAAFATTVGTPSANQPITVSGTNLTAALTVTAPGGYEVSRVAASGYAASLTIAPTAGTVPATPVYVRLTGAAVGTFGGNVLVTSTGALLRNVALTGTVGVPAPVLTSLSPPSGPVGTVVAVTGTNLNAATAVRLGSLAATFAAGTATTLTMTVPVGATTSPITVTTSGGTSNGLVFTVTAPQLAVQQGTTAYASGGAAYGFGNQVVTTASAAVAFTLRNPGTAPLAISSVTASGNFAISGALPTSVAAGGMATVGVTFTPTATGVRTGTLVIVSALGTYTLNLTGTGVVAAPVLTSLSPTSGPVGTVITVTGTNFTGATAVSINGAAAIFTVVNATTITVTVPAGASTGNLTVTTPGGSSAGALFTVVPRPVLTSLSPTSGPVGTVVTLTGTGFVGATQVSFNGVAAVPTGNSATSLSATVPTGASTGPVLVTTPGGLSNGLTFTVTAPTASRAPAASAALYPNPAHGSVTLRLPAPLARQPLTLVDALGRAVRRYPAPTHRRYHAGPARAAPRRVRATRRSQQPAAGGGIKPGRPGPFLHCSGCLE